MGLSQAVCKPICKPGCASPSKGAPTAGMAERVPRPRAPCIRGASARRPGSALGRTARVGLVLHVTDNSCHSRPLACHVGAHRSSSLRSILASRIATAPSPVVDRSRPRTPTKHFARHHIATVPLKLFLRRQAAFLDPISHVVVCISSQFQLVFHELVFVLLCSEGHGVPSGLDCRCVFGLNSKNIGISGGFGGQQPCVHVMPVVEGECPIALAPRWRCLPKQQRYGLRGTASVMRSCGDTCIALRQATPSTWIQWFPPR